MQAVYTAGKYSKLLVVPNLISGFDFWQEHLTLKFSVPAKWTPGQSGLGGAPAAKRVELAQFVQNPGSLSLDGMEVKLFPTAIGK